MGSREYALSVVSEAIELVIRNTGERPLEVTGVGAVGMDASDFVTEAEDCSGRVIDPEMRCTVALVFSPLQESILSGLQQQQAALERRRGLRCFVPFGIHLVGSDVET